MCSRTWAMPTTSSVSSKYPALTYVTIATTGAERSRRTRTVRPLDSRVRTTDAGSIVGSSAGIVTCGVNGTRGWSGLRERNLPKQIKARDQAGQAVPGAPQRPLGGKRDLADAAHGVELQHPLVEVARLFDRRQQICEGVLESRRGLPFPPHDRRDQQNDDADQPVELRDDRQQKHDAADRREADEHVDQEPRRVCRRLAQPIPR